MPIIMDNPNVVTFNQVQQTIQPQQKPNPPRVVYAMMSTKNKSFIEMHNFLKSIGIKNNKFHLALLDADLENIDPFDLNLNAYYKQKILRECIANPFYFIRECVRIPGAVPMRFELNRANLAQLFCMSLNLNVYLEIPRCDLLLSEKLNYR